MLPDRVSNPPLPASPSRAQFVMHWVTRLSPWFSLATSAWAAWTMDRHEDQSGLIVGLAALSFLLLAATTLVHKTEVTADDSRRARMHAVLRFATMAGSQSLVQGSLLFSAPFYVQASAYTYGQCAFLLAFALCTAVSLWDPWTEKAFLHPVAGPALLAFSSFVAWNAALPMIGVGHRQAIWGAAAIVSVCIPAMMFVSGVAPGKRRLQVLVGGALLPIVLAALGVSILPAAPLKVVELGIGTGVADRNLIGASSRMAEAPAALSCLSAVFAPRGLKEGLIHVWQRDGEELSRIHLAVRGGRKRGFRTWSRQPVGGRGRGVYRCEVITEFGQTLGYTETKIGG